MNLNHSSCKLDKHSLAYMLYARINKKEVNREKLIKFVVKGFGACLYLPNNLRIVTEIQIKYSFN